MLFWAVIGTIVGFLVIAAIAIVWARHQVASHRDQPQQLGDRERLLAMATQAAGDADGTQLLLLLKALETAPANGPVRVNWVPREAHGDQPGGMLLTITWDGNEWRRIHNRQALRRQLEAHMANPAYDSARARQLVADLGS